MILLPLLNLNAASTETSTSLMVLGLASMANEGRLATPIPRTFADSLLVRYHYKGEILLPISTPLQRRAWSTLLPVCTKQHSGESPTPLRLLNVLF